MAEHSIPIVVYVGIALSVLDILVSGGITLVLFRISQAVKRYDRLEDRSEKQIGEMKISLHDTTTKLIDERFRSISHQVTNSGHGLAMVIDEIKERLKHGDGLIDALDDSDHRIELKMAGKLDELKDWIRDNAATRSDLEKHEENMNGRLNQLDGRVMELAKEVAVLSDRSGKES